MTFDYFQTKSIIKDPKVAINKHLCVDNIRATEDNFGE